MSSVNQGVNGGVLALMKGHLLCRYGLINHADLQGLFLVPALKKPNDGVACQKGE